MLQSLFSTCLISGYLKKSEQYHQDPTNIVCRFPGVQVRSVSNVMTQQDRVGILYCRRLQMLESRSQILITKQIALSSSKTFGMFACLG